MVPEGWYLVQHFAKVAEPGTKNMGVPSLDQPVPITMSSVDVFRIPRKKFSC